MDDLKPIIYTIFIAIYIISRIFKGAKKLQNPTPATVQPPVEKKPESLFDTLREEIKKQQELAKSRQESKPKEQAPPKKVATASVKPKKPIRVSPAYREGEHVIDLDIKEEGGAAISKKIKTIVLPEEVIEKKFEFDPREAFKMKTLLERHPLV